MKLKIESKNVQNARVISIAGEINFNSVSEFKDCVNKVLSENPVPAVIVDMANVAYIDSAGIASFVEAMQKLKSKGSVLKMCSLTDHVKGIFASTKLDKILKIFATQEDALKA